MRIRLFVPGLTLALSIAGLANTMTAAAGATGDSTVTGRVTSVGASGLHVIVDASSGLAELNAINVGDQVQVLLAAHSPEGDRSLNTAPSRRLLGVWLLTMSGVVIVLRVRGRHTFLTSRPRDRKHVGVPAGV